MSEQEQASQTQTTHGAIKEQRKGGEEKRGLATDVHEELERANEQARKSTVEPHGEQKTTTNAPG